MAKLQQQLRKELLSKLRCCEGTASSQPEALWEAMISVMENGMGSLCQVKTGPTHRDRAQDLLETTEHRDKV